MSSRFLHARGSWPYNERTTSQNQNHLSFPSIFFLRQLLPRKWGFDLIQSLPNTYSYSRTFPRAHIYLPSPPSPLCRCPTGNTQQLETRAYFRESPWAFLSLTGMQNSWRAELREVLLAPKTGIAQPYKLQGHGLAQQLKEGRTNL